MIKAMRTPEKSISEALGKEEATKIYKANKWLKKHKNTDAVKKSFEKS